MFHKHLLGIVMAPRRKCQGLLKQEAAIELLTFRKLETILLLEQDLSFHQILLILLYICIKKNFH